MVVVRVRMVGKGAERKLKCLRPHLDNSILNREEVKVLTTPLHITNMPEATVLPLIIARVRCLHGPVPDRKVKGQGTAQCPPVHLIREDKGQRMVHRPVVVPRVEAA